MPKKRPMISVEMLELIEDATLAPTTPRKKLKIALKLNGIYIRLVTCAQKIRRARSAAVAHGHASEANALLIKVHDVPGYFPSPSQNAGWKFIILDAYDHRNKKANARIQKTK